MKNNINILITGKRFAKKLKKYFLKHKFVCMEIQNCVGFSQKFNFLEFVGVSEVKKTMLVFQATEMQSKSVVKFVLKYFNKKNNGIMFSLKGDSAMTENVMYVAIVNSGKGEQVVEGIRKTAMVGATVISGRGNGGKQDSIFGVHIDSSKEIVLSVMPKERLSLVQKTIGDSFKNSNTDVISFNMPVSDFNKLHQD